MKLGYYELNGIFTDFMIQSGIRKYCQTVCKGGCCKRCRREKKEGICQNIILCVNYMCPLLRNYMIEYYNRINDCSSDDIITYYSDVVDKIRRNVILTLDSKPKCRATDLCYGNYSLSIVDNVLFENIDRDTIINRIVWKKMKEAIDWLIKNKINVRYEFASQDHTKEARRINRCFKRLERRHNGLCRIEETSQ